MKESVLRMSEKIYIGNKYSFTKNDPKKHLGKGGNGAVYDVTTKESIDYPVVAKFFEQLEKDKEERYTRFRREILELIELGEIDGIIPIIDYHCPESIPTSPDEAWYLMPKAEEYKVNTHKDLIQKIIDMISLAKIIENLHKNKRAHRDIKPENVLIYNKKIVLADLGLIWKEGDERLTEKYEHIGPFKIIPPELESGSAYKDIDFCPADVYLFSKVVWMVIKEDKWGFRGQYNRGDSKIYLEKEALSSRFKLDIATLEPIHQLIEKATYDDYRNRIDISGCINLLNEQLSILNGDKDLNGRIDQLLFDENSKHIMHSFIPSKNIYDDKELITKLLSAIYDYALIYIENPRGNLELIHVLDIEFVDNCFIFICNDIRKNLIHYKTDIKELENNISSQEIRITLNELSDTSGYEPFSSTQKHFPSQPTPKNYYLSSSYHIIINRVSN